MYSWTHTGATRPVMRRPAARWRPRMDQHTVPRCTDLHQAVRTLRQAPLESLLDVDWRDSCMLPFLGLNDEMIHEYPEELYPWCGYGLKSWQYPNQFAGYLRHLATLDIQTYAEIGARHGGTFIITVEYLKRFGTLRKAAAIDVQESANLHEYAALWPFDYLVASSRSTEVLAYLAATRWDL